MELCLGAVWATSFGDIALPGLVAVVTTLAVEYAAKPHLEARKERILERDRAIRSLSEALVRIGQLLSYRDDLDLPDAVRHRTAEHAEVVLRLMQQALVVLDLPDDVSAGYYKACAPVVGHGRGDRARADDQARRLGGCGRRK